MSKKIIMLVFLILLSGCQKEETISGVIFEENKLSPKVATENGYVVKIEEDGELPSAVEIDEQQKIEEYHGTKYYYDEKHKEIIGEKRYENLELSERAFVTEYNGEHVYLYKFGEKELLSEHPKLYIVLTDYMIFWSDDENSLMGKEMKPFKDFKVGDDFEVNIPGANGQIEKIIFSDFVEGVEVK